jgi:hypothetical protein
VHDLLFIASTGRAACAAVLGPASTTERIDMAKPFSVALSMREAPAEAQDRAATALKKPAHSLGLRLKKRQEGQLDYRPAVGFPFLVNLGRHLDRQQMTVRFDPAEAGESGGTRVTISGAVSRGKQQLAANPEHWSEALGASPSV